MTVSVPDAFSRNRPWFFSGGNLKSVPSSKKLSRCDLLGKITVALPFGPTLVRVR